MQFPPSALATQLLGDLSHGVEIGAAAHNPFGLPGCLFVDFTDRRDTIFQADSERLHGERQRIDVVALGDRLPFADGSLDYVVSSHVIEHLFDPIGAMREWLRVVRPGGYVFCIVPHKERTFDRDRPRTSLAELLARYRGEIRLAGPDTHEHHSVWTTIDFVELCVHMGWQLIAIQDIDDKVGNGFTVVVQRPIEARTGSIATRSLRHLKRWLRETKPRAPNGVVVPVASAAEAVAFNIEECWTDHGGTYMSGWACDAAATLQNVAIEIGGVLQPIRHFFARPDVGSHFPTNPAAVHSGFEVFVPATATEGSLYFDGARGRERRALPVAVYATRSASLFPANGFRRAPHEASAIRLALAVEKFWADRHGYYFAGWAHAYDERLHSLEIGIDSRVAAAKSFTARPDLAPHFPDHLYATRSGFELYIEAPPGYPIELTAQTTEGARQTWRLLPPHVPLTPQMYSVPIGPMESHAACTDLFAKHIAESKGVVVELGARKVSPHYVDHRATFPQARRYIGVDIHPGIGVDVVADAHSLSQTLSRDSVDGLISNSVLEHLACPWLVAAEINKVLRPGGLVLLTAPWTWPGHEYPNDFWRFSEHGLAVLFGPALGFETLSAGQFGDYRVYPDNSQSAYRQMPLIPAYAASYVCARKVASIDDGAVRWPMAAASLQSKSQTYPVRPE